MKTVLIIRNYSSLVPMFIGAALYFITNLMLKQWLNDTDYGNFALLITIYSMIASFGMFGVEQAMMRLGEKQPGIPFSVDKSFVKYIWLSFFLGPLVFSLLSVFYFKEYEVGIIEIYIYSLSSVLLIFFYSFERINANYFLAQTINNFWRFSLFFGVLIIYAVKKKLQFLDIFYALTCAVVLAASIGLYKYSLRPLILTDNPSHSDKSNIKYIISFFVSLLVMSFISFGDKFLLESKFGIEELGRYFFLTTIFLFPYRFFEGYLGFKELVIFKQTYNTELFVSKLKKTLILGSLFGLSLISMGYLIDYFSIYQLKFFRNWQIITLLVILGNVKLVYALFSAVTASQLNYRSLNLINVISLLATSLVGLFAFFAITNIIGLILLFISVWLIRIITMYAEISKVNVRLINN